MIRKMRAKEGEDGRAGETTPLKCSNMAKLLRSWMAIIFK